MIVVIVHKMWSWMEWCACVFLSVFLSVCLFVFLWNIMFVRCKTWLDMFSFDFTLKFCLVWVMGLTFLFGKIKVTYHMSYHIGWRMKVFQISFCVMCVSDFWEQTVWCNGLDYSHLCGAVYFWWSKRSAFHLGQVRHCSPVLGSVHLSSFHIIWYLRICMILKSFQIAPI